MWWIGCGIGWWKCRQTWRRAHKTLYRSALDFFSIGVVFMLNNVITLAAEPCLPFQSPNLICHWWYCFRIPYFDLLLLSQIALLRGVPGRLDRHTLILINIISIFVVWTCNFLKWIFKWDPAFVDVFTKANFGCQVFLTMKNNFLWWLSKCQDVVLSICGVLIYCTSLQHAVENLLLTRSSCSLSDISGTMKVSVLFPTTSCTIFSTILSINFSEYFTAAGCLSTCSSSPYMNDLSDIDNQNYLSL